MTLRIGEVLKRVPDLTDSRVRDLAGYGYIPVAFGRRGSQRSWCFTEESVSALLELKPYLDQGLRFREAHERVLEERWRNYRAQVLDSVRDLIRTGQELASKYPATFEELTGADQALEPPLREITNYVGGLLIRLLPPVVN